MQYSLAGPGRRPSSELNAIAPRSSTSPTGSERTLTPDTPNRTTNFPAAGPASAPTAGVTKENGFSIGRHALTPGSIINRAALHKPSQLAINAGFANQEYIVFTGRHTTTPALTTPLSAVPHHMSSTSSHPTTPTSTSSEPIVHSSGYVSAFQSVLPGPQSATSSVPNLKVSASSEKYSKSVKHLTCFYWHRYGKCNKSEDDCLYAHHLTGQLADEPRHVEPGRPAVAGRNARVKIPVHQNWRGAPATEVSTSQNSMAYVTSTNEHTSPFSYNQIYGSGTAHDSSLPYSASVVSNVPPPPSSLTQRFINMTVDQSSKVTHNLDERRIHTLRGIIDLQAHLARASQERFATISNAVKFCRTELSMSASSLHDLQDSFQPHLNVVGALVNEYLKIESEAEAMSERIKLTSLEVNRELAKAGFPIPL